MGSDPLPPAVRWHLANRADEPSFQAQAKAAVAWLPPGRVLDLGCGTGALASSLSAEWVGLDRDPAMLAGAGRRVAGAALVRGAAEALPFRDECFAAVVTLGLFEYLSGPGAALAEVARILEPGGVAVLAVPRRESPYRRGLVAVAPLLSAMGRSDPFDLKAGARVTLAKARRWGRKAGLLLRETTSVAPSGLPWPLERAFPRLASRLARRLPASFGTVRLLRFRKPIGRTQPLKPGGGAG